jgi:hypothetical protein
MPASAKGTTTMTLDDESFLSAYLDGQLDVPGREAVEAALSLDPGLAEKLASLRKTRNLVSTLSRPAPTDLSSGVLRRISEPRPRSRPWDRARHALPWIVSGLASAAAVALIVLSPRRPEGRPDTRPTPPGTSAASAAADRAGRRAGPDGATAARRGSAPAAGEPSPEDEDSATGILPPDQSLGFQDTDRTEVLRARALLEDPSLRHVFLITDVIGDPAWEQLSTALKQSTRHDYYRITVSQGIVIDPEHPGEASVFALVLEDSQLDAFRKRLKKAFESHVEERAVEPAVVAQLADIGQVASVPPDPVGDLMSRPPELLARRERGQPTLEQERSAVNAERRNADRLTPESPPSSTGRTADKGQESLAASSTPSPAREGSSDAPPVARPGGPSSESSERLGTIPRNGGTGQPVVVLVWATRGPSG